MIGLGPYVLIGLFFFTATFFGGLKLTFQALNFSFSLFDLSQFFLAFLVKLTTLLIGFGYGLTELFFLFLNVANFIAGLFQVFFGPLERFFLILNLRLQAFEIFMLRR